MHFIDAPAKFVLVIGAVLGVILFNLPLPTVKELTGEGDLVENLSSVVLGVVVLLTAFQAARTRSPAWLSATVMAVWMFLRELDFQRRFTPRSVESLGFYTRGTIPLQMKLVVLAILAPFVMAGLHLLWLGKKRVAQGIRTREIWIGYLATGAGVVGVALLFEKFLKDATGVIEEVSELTFAGLVLMLVLHYVVGWSKKVPTPGGQEPPNPPLAAGEHPASQAPSRS